MFIAKKIIVTGGSGFVGQSTTKFLTALGHQVFSLSLRGDWKATMPQNHDVLLHLAGINSGKHSESEYKKINYQLSKEVFQEAKAKGVKCFIFMSSIKVVDEGDVASVLTEQTPSDPKSAYGKSKWKLEKWLEEQKEQMQIIILRPCMIYSAANLRALKIIEKMVKLRIPYPFPFLKNKRSYLSMDNLHLVLAKLIEEEQIAGTFHLSDDEPLSMSELVAAIAHRHGIKVRSSAVGGTVILFGLNVLNRFGLKQLQSLVNKFTGNFVVDNSKIKTALAIHQLRTTKETISNLLLKDNLDN